MNADKKEKCGQTKRLIPDYLPRRREEREEEIQESGIAMDMSHCVPVKVGRSRSLVFEFLRVFASSR
jgi:hypothetical protein